MPKSRRSDPLYRRGHFALYPRSGRSNLEIVWYDAGARRERSASARTADIGQGKIALDRHYLKHSGTRICPTCGREADGGSNPLLSAVIADYLIRSEGKAGEKSAKGRLGHVLDYLEARPETRCAEVDERWISDFRRWLSKRPVVVRTRKGEVRRPRSIGAVEGCVLQLAAAINDAPGQEARFKAEQPKTVAKSPTYRADIKKLAAMFRFALAEPHRDSLLRYLRMAVATWARPDAIFDARPVQWLPEAHVLDLNPPNRKQTKKHRPKIPVARQMVPFLDSGEAFLSVGSVRCSWEKMRAELGLPGEREAGVKLIRRSVATIARRRIGEANWRQGEMMLGHVKHSVSDIYALVDPANLGLALAVTEAIIDEIDQLAPGAFYRAVTANGSAFKVVEGGKNA